jgi:cyanate permease
VTSLLVVARIGGSLTVPALSDRAGLRRPAVIGCGALATLGTLGVVAGGASLAATVAAVALVGVGIGGLAPLVRAIPVELDGIGPRLTATANGLIFTVGEVGGFSGPFLIGGLRDLTGSFLPGFLALALGAAVVVVAGRLMAEPGAGAGAGADGPTG